MLRRLVGRIQGCSSRDIFLVLTVLALVSVASGCAGVASPNAKTQTPPPPPPTPSSFAITTSSLPAGQMGTGYQATLSASGGTTPYSWSLSTGTLPAGLSLN